MDRGTRRIPKSKRRAQEPGTTGGSEGRVGLAGYTQLWAGSVSAQGYLLHTDFSMTMTL